MYVYVYLYIYIYICISQCLKLTAPSLEALDHLLTCFRVMNAYSDSKNTKNDPVIAQHTCLSKGHEVASNISSDPSGKVVFSDLFYEDFPSGWMFPVEEHFRTLCTTTRLVIKRRALRGVTELPTEKGLCFYDALW